MHSLNKASTTQMDLIKQILVLAIPIIGTFLAQKIIQVTNTFMLGHLGVLALAAGSIFMTFYMLLLVVCMGIFNALNVFISREIGANRNEQISVYFIQGIYIAFLVSAPIMLCLWYAPKLLGLIPEYQEIAAPALNLSRASSFGIPGTLIYFVLRETMTAFKLPKINLYVVLVAIPLLVIIEYNIVFVLHTTDLNRISYVGYANSFIEWFLALALFGYCFISKKTRQLLFIGSSYNLVPSAIKEIVRLGLPTAMIFALDMGMVLVAGFVVGYYGAPSLSAFQVALQCTTAAYMFPVGLGFAVTTLISYQFGANNFSEIKRVFKIGVTIGIAIAAVILIGFIVFRYQISMFFLSGKEAQSTIVVDYATKFLIIAGVVQLFDAGQAIANGVLRGMGDVLIPMYFSVACYWLIGVGSILILCFVFKIGAIGIWLGMALSVISAFVVITSRCFKIIKLKQAM